MNDRLQFPCPSCGKTLIVPVSAAGARGPCPRCNHLIIGPDPSRGLPAQLAVVDTPWTAQAPARPAPQPSGHPAANPEAPSPADPLPGDAPAKRPESQLAPPSGAARTGISPAVLVLSCLLCAGLAFIGGFLACQYKLGTAPIDHAPQQARPTNVPRDSVPLKTWLPTEQTAPTGSGPASSSGPVSVLRAFLSAPGWAARSAHVLGSEEVHRAMAVHAATHGDGPIETTEISLLQEGEDSHVFVVKTPRIPSGFPVALARTEAGWLVDWQTFSEFHHDRFQSFATKPTDAQETFHLLVNRLDSGEDGENASFRLNPPMPGREQLALVRRDSPAHSTINAVFEEQRELDPETYQQLIAARGLPLVVVLSSRSSGDGQKSLWIEDVTAVGWGPRVPESAPES